MASRRQNEKAFGQWQDLPGGGRIYVRQIAGRSGAFARYCKETDAAENTVRFWQEIYDRNGKLAARHEKFPFDSGHQIVQPETMKVTRQTVARQIADYLHGRLAQAQLVDWAERAVMEADFAEADAELLADIVGRLGLADVAEFGLRWEDCEKFLTRLGYRARVEVEMA